jgi:hypothetical protein
MNMGIVGSNPIRGMVVCPHLPAMHCPVYVKAFQWALPCARSYQT